MIQRIRFASTIAFLLVCMAGFVFVVWGWFSPSGRNVLVEAEWRALLDGRFTAKVDRAVVGFLPSDKELNSFINGGLYALTGDAGAQVRSGCPGWLYLAEELVEVPAAEVHLRERAVLAEKIYAEIKSRGIALISLPIPDKAELAGQGRCGLAMSAMAQSRPVRWEKAAGSLNLKQVDVAHDWPQPGFWRTDTHWSREGAAFAARRTAQALSLLIGVGDEEVTLKRAPQATDRVGDLARLANLELYAGWFGPAVDREVIETADIKRSGGLLDDTPTPQVLLAGSSYSLNSGFLDYLQTEAKREIVQKSRAGGGFAGALLDLLNSNPDSIKGIKAIVWEWPMRSLDLPLTDDEKNYLRTQP